MSDSSAEITILLQRLSSGSREAEAELIPHIYNDLRRIAARYLQNERPGHTLQTTALVHEAYLRLVNQREASWRNRNQFFAVAAQIMQRILVDHARAKQALKRGGSLIAADFDAAEIGNPTQDGLHIALDEALNRLKLLDPRQTRIVVMRFYGGLTEEEIAETLGISSRTVKRDWQSARTWLHAELSK